MKGKVFADSNILIYLLGGNGKKSVAEKIVSMQPIISTQVINENINVSGKKLKISLPDIEKHIEELIKTCTVKNITLKTIESAIIILKKYHYHYYDCLIIASALENKCSTLYSEDMQHGQVIENKLTIINPFVKK